MYNMEVRIVLKAGITYFASSIGTPIRRGALDTTLCDKVCQWLATGRWFFPGTLRSSTNKTDRHDITEILLKVELNTIHLYWRPVLEETRGTRQYLPICYTTINLLDYWNNKKTLFSNFFLHVNDSIISWISHDTSGISDDRSSRLEDILICFYIFVFYILSVFRYLNLNTIILKCLKLRV
jgi:hypothetical protein